MNHPADDIILARYGAEWRWYPNPESRKRGSQRWILPAVERWHRASSPAVARASFSQSEAA